MRGFFHSQLADVAKYTPSAQLLPGARAPIIISPHRRNGNNAGFVLVHSLVPEKDSCRKMFPVSEEEMAERSNDLRSNWNCSILLKLNYVNTELVLSS